MLNSGEIDKNIQYWQESSDQGLILWLEEEFQKIQ